MRAYWREMSWVKPIRGNPSADFGGLTLASTSCSIFAQLTQTTEVYQATSHLLRGPVMTLIKSHLGKGHSWDCIFCRLQ